MMKTLGMFILSLVLSACGSGETDERRQETVGAEIANDYNRQMQRARNVELQLDEQKRDLDAAIEAQSQGRRDP